MYSITFDRCNYVQKTAEPKHWNFILFCLSFTVILYCVIGLTTPITGAIVRYKIPAAPFLFMAVLLIFDSGKLPESLTKKQMHKMDQYIFITGASSGFGEATARLFAEKGFHLILMARREDKLLKLKNELSAKVDVIIIGCDVRDENAVNKSIDQLSDEVASSISVLVNNAGLAVGKGPIDQGLTDDWNRMVDTNIKGLLYVTKAIVPIFKKNKKGHIINIARYSG